MKVAERSDTWLVIRGAGLGRILLIGGVVWILIDLVIFAFIAQTATLACSRAWQPDPCRIERKLLGITIKKISLSSLREAYVDESEDSDGDITYRVVLATDEGSVPLTSSYSSGYGSKRDTANEINAFLQNREQQTLEVTESAGWWLLFAVVFFAVGIGLVVAGINTMGLSWIFDKEQGLLVKERRAWGQVSVEEFPLSQIRGAHVRVSRDSDGDTYRIELRLLSGEILPLTGFYSSGHRAKQETVLAIRDFLGLPDEAMMW